MSKLLISTLILIFFVLHNIQAQDKIDTTFQSSVAEIMKNKPKEEENTVTSATKTEQSLAEAPNLLSVVQRRQFIDLGYVSLNNVVWNLPGFSVSRDYDRYAISSRGNFENWNNNHMLMLVDGIPFNESIYGSAMTSEVTPLVFIKSVEVMRGAGSALYGTNAMNGLMNIKTVSPSDLKGNVEARTRITNNGTQIYDAIAGVNHDRLSLVAAFNHYYTSGNNYESYDGSGRLDSNGNLQKFITKDRRESSYFFAKADFKGKFTGLSFQYHEHLWNYGTGHGWAFQIPDQDEVLRESRRILALTYKTPKADKKLNYELVLRYQRKGIDWDMRLLPDNAKLGTTLYLNGLSERVKTNINDLFTRIQTSYQFKNKTLLLSGLENTFLYYTGDDLHTSNVDVSSTFLPNPNNTFTKLGGYLEYMQNHLVVNTGIFAQYISPKFIAQRMTVTAGLRLDNQLFNYTDITQINRPILSKSFTQLNPRLSLVFKTTDKLYLKAMFGRAFRTPSPAEIFSANTCSSF
jgi:outer membrane receptor protein involved in Fe transport